MTLNYLKRYDDAISNYDLSINLEPKNAIIYKSKGITKFIFFIRLSIRKITII